MSEKFQGQASCLCGAVKLSASSVSTDLGACHCSMCRKWAGGPLFAVDCGTDVVVDGKENLTVFPSSEWAERGFCSTCGSNLFFRLKGSGQYIVLAGLFEGEPEFVFGHQVFVDERPSYYNFENETHDMTGAEVFAKYGPPEE